MGEPAWARDITNREILTRQVGVSADVGGIVGVFSRMQSYKKSETPPPPYEPPPPYHIALVSQPVPTCYSHIISILNTIKMKKPSNY